MSPNPARRRWLAAIVAACAGLFAALAPDAVAAPCDAPVTNPVACENTKAGNPASEWDVSGAGSTSIQGFATNISVDQGGTISFKVDTNATNYRIDVYRMGYYNGLGARKVATVEPLAVLPQLQPNCASNGSTGLTDCGNWGVSATWTVPGDAVSGIYIAKLVREDGTAGSSHMVFVVRDDNGASDLLFQTSDTTWQAYNQYGGASLYTGGPGPQGGAYKVSYNRPFTTRGYAPEDWVFNAEYPMVRWLERNGFNVSYTSGVDMDRAGAELLEHRAFLSVGHDEYWSNTQRANVEAARAAGVNLAFFSGNEVFWKTRWEDAHRTLVTYKETHANGKIDPAINVWTGTWRDPRFSPPADGGRPENALTGQLFMVNAGATTAIRVPEADGKMRFWRNTNIATQAAGATATLPAGTLGYEWDADPDNGFRPAGAFRLSSTTVTGAPILTDYGSSFGSGTAEHNMTLYRAPSGARVFGAGTVQWPWGLDSNHDRGSAAADVRMQQATVNLFADMSVQPSTLMTGLTAATASTDANAPASAITAPAPNASITPGSQVTISGTASDTGGGVVGGVEVSTDNGQTWHRATGRGPWTYTWTASGSGTTTLRSRAVDDSGNLESPGPGVTVTVGTGSQTCPCSIWGAGAVPARPAETTDPNAVELGVKFRSQTAGRIAGIRFYKGSTNTGTHVGHLWTRTGTLLASATFTNETATGWQQVRFASPVDIAAGTTYIASYHAPNGNYATNLDGFAAAGVDSPPLRALRDGEDGGNGLYAYGPSGTFPNGTYRSENYWVDVVLETGADETAPTVTSVTPGRGATGIAATANVTAQFSEPVDPTTVTASTITLRDPSGALVPAAVSYDAGSQTATLDPNQSLAATTVYTALVKGGSAGVKDFAGNAMSSDDSWTFTTRAPTQSGCPCSIWAASARPLREAETTDNSAVEIGTKFRSDLDGVITGLRFYKGATNTGTHVGHLWTRTGQLLATATFANETASGWQEVTFANPVSISADTTYVASYHAPRGNYAVNDQQFLAAGVDNPPLHALRDGVDGGNGVYAYGASGTFPAGTFRSHGYWVDVVFDTNTGPDTTPPTVTGRLPAPDAQGVAPASNASVSFSEAMEAASITTATFQLRDPGGNVVPAAVSYDAGSRTATLDPQGVLADSTRYTATVKGGTGGVTDRAGNPLAADASWAFTTAAPPGPGPDDGPGGPVLVIAKSTNPFSRYYAEILRAEGVNAFAVRDIANVTPATLAGFDAAVLGDFALNAGQVTMLGDWVTNGGDLIAMRPDKQLAGLLGLTDASATLSNAYMRVDASRQPGAGIVAQTMQFHGTADRYGLNGATSLADLYSSASTATTAPAVTMRSVGANGGRAAAFTYDLARSIVYTRQGNPAWAGQERDGFAPIRSDDLFFGAAPFDPQPNWVDLGKVAIPQADEQQRLLVNLIGLLTADKKPMPRFWYFPRGLKAAVIMTGDDHGNGGTAGRWNQYLAASPAGCSVAQWECIRGSSYVYPSTPLTDAQAASFQAQGFEVGLHVNTGCGDFSQQEYDDLVTSQLIDFHAEYPSIGGPFTNRNHCIAYSDWASTPKVELAHGMRLDGNYYYWPPGWVQNVPGMFTGSGMPMRFADTDGSMIDVYQATTQMTDESDQTFPFTIDTLLDRALGSTGYYGAFNANMHTDQAAHAGSDAIVASAKARGVPVVSAQQMLTWLDGRNGSTFSAIQYSGGVLSFRVSVGAGATALRGMVPAVFGGQALQAMTRDGAPVSFTREVIKGVDYAFFAAGAGNYTATYAPDTTAPAISSVNAVAAADGTATVTWTTNEPSDSRVDYGTSAALGLQSAPDATPVTAHSVRLTGLTPGATYHYRVRSADGAGNASTSPAAANPPATFGVPVAPVTKFPAATVIETGTLRGGNAAALTADDNVYYQVNSTTTGTRTTSWYGSFTGVPAALSGLSVTYRGRNSASCTQTIAAWRWTDSTWQQLHSGALGNTETTRADLVPPGAAGNYVSPTGELRVRVRCTRTANFFASGELLRITYTP
jgi:Domain of unknown function (DUF4082)/Bacterial Ig-like domain/Bacterial Ig domain/Purple acid Phosphatase, N-terminal domain